MHYCCCYLNDWYTVKRYRYSHIIIIICTNWYVDFFFTFCNTYIFCVYSNNNNKTTTLCFLIHVQFAHIINFCTYPVFITLHSYIRISSIVAVLSCIYTYKSIIYGNDRNCTRIVLCIYVEYVIKHD